MNTKVRRLTCAVVLCMLLFWPHYYSSSRDVFSRHQQVFYMGSRNPILVIDNKNKPSVHSWEFSSLPLPSPLGYVYISKGWCHYSITGSYFILMVSLWLKCCLSQIPMRAVRLRADHHGWLLSCINWYRLFPQPMYHRLQGRGSTTLHIRATSSILQLHAFHFHRDRQFSTGKEILRNVFMKMMRRAANGTTCK